MRNVIQQSPTYLAETKSKSTKFWIIYITMDNSKRYISTETWITKANGEESTHKYSGLTEILPKNIGKANETSIIQQAELEYAAQIQKKIDEGYHLAGEASKTYLLPQLANKFDINKFDNYPVVTQAKYDGIRSLLTNTNFYSRKGKDFIPELFELFSTPLPDGIHLDGELMLGDGYTFQETISAVKKYSELSKKLVYYVYDLYDSNHPDLIFTERYDLLYSLVGHLDDNILIVPNGVVGDRTGLLATHSINIECGYEGTMIRLDKPYTPNHRSAHLLKYKDFVDAEFRIIDVVSGNGLYHDCGIFVCMTDNGGIFNVMLADTIEKKREVLANSDDYIGRYLTVKFQEYTDGGIPRFPVGQSVRDFDLQG